MLPLRHINSCTPINPDIGTIVARYGLPKVAACHGVEPSYDLPIKPTLPFDQPASPSQVTAASIPRCSSVPIKSIQWLEFPVPNTETWATP